MNVDELLVELNKNDVELWLDGDLLRFRAPEGKLNNRLLANLRRHKAALIEHLGEASKKENEQRQWQAMSVGQEALYFLHRLAPRSAAYNVASAARILSRVDVSAMQVAIGELVQRHELLRSTFELHDGQPACAINHDLPPDFAQVDMPGATPTELHAAVVAEYKRPFDLASGPLFRTRLFTIEPECHVLLFALHHIAFDFWSLWLIHDELQKLYAQHTTGETALLPTATASYFDFADKQQSMLAGERGESLWRYWRDRLDGDLTPLELPCDFKRPEQISYAGATHHFPIPDELSDKLRRYAADHGATPFMLLLALFKTCLQQLCDRKDLIVGTTTAGRSSEFTKVVGYFVNTLAIRSDAKETEGFAQFLAQVKQRTLEAIEHQDFPFPTLIDRLNPVRERGQQPICNVMFGVQKPQQFSGVQQLMRSSDETMDWGGLQIQAYELDQQEGQFDLTLELFDTGESFVGALKYNVDLFKLDTIERFAERYLSLAAKVVSEEETRLTDIDLVDQDERSELLTLAEGEPLEHLGDARMHVLFEETVSRYPDSIAAQSGDQSVSYESLNCQANQLARLLIHRGVGPGIFVACSLERGMDVPLALLAILKAGGTYVPIDRANPPERISQILQQCGDHTICLRSVSDGSDSLSLDQCRDELATLDDSNLDLTFGPGTRAYSIFTSGSTGQPKGVVVPHEAIARHIVSIRQVFDLSQNDRVLQFSNLGFDPSLEQLLAPLTVGATVVLRGENLLTPEQFWQFADEHRLSVVNVPPAYFRECSEFQASSPVTVPSLRLLIVGGDEFPAETMSVWNDAGVRVLNAYGPTEAVITATTFDATQSDSQGGSLPIGRPKPGMRAYVFNSQGRLAPIGTPGELYLAGDMLAHGYLGDDELTEQKFVPDPLSEHFENSSGDRMYRTGDRARWNRDGNLEFLGRQDQQIKVNGFRVETGEIESKLSQHEGVRQCHVELRTVGQSGKQLIAWVVGNCESVSGEVLRSFATTHLPTYMVPRQFVVLDELPLRISGKIDSDALPVPTLQRDESEPLVPPSNEVERILVQIWLDTLEVSPIGIHDSFFDLGGGSLTSLRIASRATDAGLVADGSPIEPELLFRFPTVAQLATQLTKQSQTEPAAS